MTRRSASFAIVLLAAACSKPKTPYVIEIDVDDHGLKGLWDAQAPNLKRLIREGTFGYTRVVLPTHSNENNMTLVTGNWPDGHNVPTNGYLERDNNFTQAISLGGAGVGDYVYYDHNPLSPLTPHHVDSVWTTTSAGGGSSLYVGELPPWEVGADQVHFTIAGTGLAGIPLDSAQVREILTNILRYPTSDLAKIHIDGPPDAGESYAHFTLRDAAAVWAQAAQVEPPRYMFAWDFIALDNDPTTHFGADSSQIAAVIDDYDDALGDLLQAVEASPYKDQVNILFTLDHGKVDTTHQVALGSQAGDGQLGALVSLKGVTVGVTNTDYGILNEDGDALVYIETPDAGNAGGENRQEQLAHGMVDLIQSGALQGVDTTRTMTWDGYRGTRRFHDYRIETPNQADIIVYPLPGWTLNDVDGTGKPGVFDPTKHPFPYGRHGGFSDDELYVPLILWGPAFKQGQLLPHPTDHAQVAPTAMAALGLSIPTAETGPIAPALLGDPGDTIPQPSDMTTARDTVLGLAGFGTSATLAGAPATQAVVVDVPGLYYDEVFEDGVTAGHASGLWNVAKSGVVFESTWNRSRDFAENAYELLVGGAPIVDSSGKWIGGADADPGQTAPPGQGMLLEPPPAIGTAANPASLATWRADAGTWATDSILSVASAHGFATALIGDAATALEHVSPPAQVFQVSDDDAAGTLATFLAASPKALAFVSLSSPRTGDRESSAARDELEAISKRVSALRQAAPNALFVVSSRGGADVDDASGDYYGPQSSRHVPLIIVGPNVRTAVDHPVFSGQPATAADIPATVLFGLGLPSRTDLGEGTWIQGTANADGVPQPLPSGATGGHVLARAYSLR